MDGTARQRLGRSLLSTVEEAAFCEVLRDAWHHAAIGEENDHGIQIVDDILRDIQRLHDKATEPSAVEVTSLLPGSGKTHVLYHIIASAARKRYRDARKVIAIFDTDCTFDVDRLVTVIMQDARDHNKSDDNRHDIEDILKDVLIFQPHSMRDMVNSVRALPDFLLDRSSLTGQDLQLALIVFDSISTFLWQKLHTDEHNRLHSETLQDENKSTCGNEFEELVESLRAIQKAYDTKVIASSWTLAPGSIGSDGRILARTHLPTIWQQYVSLRLVLHRKSVNRFPVQLDDLSASRDGNQRQDVVDQGAHTMYIDTSSLRKRMTREALSALRARNALQKDFHISKGGFRVGSLTVS